MSSVPQELEVLPRGRPRGPAAPEAMGVVGRERQEHMSAFDSRHMSLIDSMIAWAIANPGQPFTRMAMALGGPTALTLRQIASTDAYKARLREVAPEVLEAVGIAPLKAKIEAAAAIAIDRLSEKLATADSVSEIVDATEVLLSGIYGKGQGAAQLAAANAPSQNIQVNATILMGREMILGGQAPNPPPEPQP